MITMTVEEKILKFEDKKVLNRDVLYELIREVHPNYKDASIRWVIYGLVKKGIITKLDSYQFIIGRTTSFYQRNPSEERNKIVNILNQKFPNIRIVAYESTLLNEWVNHQIARKVIFIESEKYFVNDVFRLIYNECPNKVLLNPTKEDLYMYDGELVIVTQLVSQAPINLKSRDIKIEKLIVDLFTKDLITEFVNDDEKDEVVASIFKSYPVNDITLYAYAKRRKNLGTVKKAVSSYAHGGLS